MKYNSKIPLLITLIIISTCFLSTQIIAKPADSLRVGMVMKDIKALTVTIQDSIIPNLEADNKKKMKEMVASLKDMLKKSETMFKDTNQTDFKKLSAEE